jgi:hypothetical protein
MAVQIKPGTLDSFGNSMAKAIEEELDKLLQADGLAGLPMDEGEARDRRRLFVAIARGVVRHLEQRREAIDVAIPIAGDPKVSPSFDIEGKDW